MTPQTTIYILGAGVVGWPLAAYLAQAGRAVVAVRTSRADVAPSVTTVTVQNGDQRCSVPIQTVSLAQLPHLAGLLVITAKSYANRAIAQELQKKAAAGPVVLLQNGVGMEEPFITANFAPVYRGVLYVTSQATAADEFSFRPVTASPIGLVHGANADLEQCVAHLTTAGFPLRAEAHIAREVWQKAIINVVFNSLCPLLDVDNGIFWRDPAVAHLASTVVQECVMLTARLGLDLTESELMAQIRLISQRSNGQLISTLQDLRAGRPTEIEFLNLAMARRAASLQPPLALPRTELLGQLILARSGQAAA